MKKSLLIIACLSVSLLATAQKSDSVLLFDGFDDNKNNWPVNQYSNEIIKLAGGKLIVNAKDANRYYNVIPFTLPADKNISVSASVKYVLGEQNSLGSGLCFGYKKYNTNCDFVISSKGFYQIIAIKDGDLKQLTPWTPSDLIKKDPGAENILTVKKENKKWYFFINDKFVTAQSSIDISENNIGFTSSGPAEISFDDLTVKEYTKSAVTLFIRLGGKDAIDVLVSELLANVVGDTRINQKFVKVNYPVFLKNLQDYFCSITGGGCKYEGNDMKTAHKAMGITDGEYKAFVEDLAAALTKYIVPEKEKREMLDLMKPIQSQIVEKKGDPKTGTKLPTGYKSPAHN